MGEPKSTIWLSPGYTVRKLGVTPNFRFFRVANFYENSDRPYPESFAYPADSETQLDLANPIRVTKSEEIFDVRIPRILYPYHDDF